MPLMRSSVGAETGEFTPRCVANAARSSPPPMRVGTLREDRERVAAVGQEGVQRDLVVGGGVQRHTVEPDVADAVATSTGVSSRVMPMKPTFTPSTVAGMLCVAFVWSQQRPAFARLSCSRACESSLDYIRHRTGDRLPSTPGEPGRVIDVSGHRGKLRDEREMWCLQTT